jgi:hypothetical protein
VAASVIGVTVRALVVVLVVGVVLAIASWAVASGTAGWRIAQTPSTFGNDGFGVFVSGISCPTTNSCIAAGYGGTSQPLQPSQPHLGLTLQGSRWSLLQTPIPPSTAFAPDVDGVSCSSTRWCVIVGTYVPNSSVTDVPYAEAWNGRTWSLQQLPSPNMYSVGLNSVSCVSSRACVAVGYYDWLDKRLDSFIEAPLAESWNGTDWTSEPLRSPYAKQGGVLWGVSCTSARACTATGAYSRPYGKWDLPLVERWTGRRWSLENTPNPRPDLFNSTLYAVSCTSRTACMAVGLRSIASEENPVTGSVPAPLAERWNGQRWSITPSPKVSNIFLSGVSCVSGSDCLAVGAGAPDGVPLDIGGGDATVAEQWNGTRWAVQHPAQPVRGYESIWLNGVSCPSKLVCFAGGSWIEMNPYEQISHALVDRWSTPGSTRR